MNNIWLIYKKCFNHISSKIDRPKGSGIAVDRL
jgi:hypothetical protein